MISVFRTSKLLLFILLFITSNLFAQYDSLIKVLENEILAVKQRSLDDYIFSRDSSLIAEKYKNLEIKFLNKKELPGSYEVGLFNPQTFEFLIENHESSKTQDYRTSFIKDTTLILFKKRFQIDSLYQSAKDQISSQKRKIDSITTSRRKEFIEINSKMVKENYSTINKNLDSLYYYYALQIESRKQFQSTLEKYFSQLVESYPAFINQSNSNLIYRIPQFELDTLNLISYLRTMPGNHTFDIMDRKIRLPNGSYMTQYIDQTNTNEELLELNRVLNIIVKLNPEQTKLTQQLGQLYLKGTSQFLASLKTRLDFYLSKNTEENPSNTFPVDDPWINSNSGLLRKFLQLSLKTDVDLIKFSFDKDARNNLIQNQRIIDKNLSVIENENKIRYIRNKQNFMDVLHREVFLFNQFLPKDNFIDYEDGEYLTNNYFQQTLSSYRILGRRLTTYIEVMTFIQKYFSTLSNDDNLILLKSCLRSEPGQMEILAKCITLYSQYYDIQNDSEMIFGFKSLLESEQAENSFKLLQELNIKLVEDCLEFL